MMKKNFKSIIILLMLVLTSIGTSVKAQGTDVIFWIDDSASMSLWEWNDAGESIRSIIDEVIGCNPYNRGAVVHYGSTALVSQGAGKSKIYIESDFTNNTTTLKNFSRRSDKVGGGDDAPEALGLIGKALDGVSDSKIVSPQKTLNRISTNRLVIFFFTDASRALLNSYLVQSGSDPFKAYNEFKSERKATFVAIYAGGTNASKAAVAAISSVGGSYTGDVEANAGDPEGSGVKPRRTVISSTFSFSAEDIATIADNICSACAPTVEIDDITPTIQSTCLNGSVIPITLDAQGSGTLSYQWYENTTNSYTGGTAISGATSVTYTPPTNVAGVKYYYAIVSDSYCEGTTQSPIVSITTDSVSCTNGCTQPATGGTPDGYSKVGITVQQKQDAWPENIPNGWIALESKEKGFVITRVAHVGGTDGTPASTDSVTDPKEGMLVYDIEDQCVKLYNGTIWNCIQKSCNE